MKKYIWTIVVGAVILVVGAFLLGKYAFPEDSLKSLPAPEVSEGQRGELGIDKNINEGNIDDYLGRSDSVYRDMRMLDDPGDYEAIGGDSKLSGFVRGFEVVPLPYLVNVSGLPEAVGSTYTGPTLFHQHSDGSFTANYEEYMAIVEGLFPFDGENYKENYAESMEALETLFPKDKVIFLMCGGGGYAGMMKNMLVALGWDESKIYNVGGYWYYDGDNNVKVRRDGKNGEAVYDFYKVPYHEFDFDVLTEI